MQSEKKSKASQSQGQVSPNQSQPIPASEHQNQTASQKPSLILGVDRIGVGEVRLSKLNGDTWTPIASDIFAIIEGKLREQLYNEVFLK
jgi:hypothetical protein